MVEMPRSVRRRLPAPGDAEALLSASRAAVVRTSQLVERAQSLFDKWRQLRLIAASPIVSARATR
jgi:hypothetical protein